MLGAILPPWAHDGRQRQILERLASPQLRQRMVLDMEQGIPGWIIYVDFAGLDQIFVPA